MRMLRWRLQLLASLFQIRVKFFGAIAYRIKPGCRQIIFLENSEAACSAISDSFMLPNCFPQYWAELSAGPFIYTITNHGDNSLFGA